MDRRAAITVVITAAKRRSCLVPRLPVQLRLDPAVASAPCGRARQQTDGRSRGLNLGAIDAQVLRPLQLHKPTYEEDDEELLVLLLLSLLLSALVAVGQQRRHTALKSLSLGSSTPRNNHDWQVTPGTRPQPPTRWSRRHLRTTDTK